MHHLFFRVTHDGRDVICSAANAPEALDDYARDIGFDGAADMAVRMRGLGPEIEDITAELLDAGTRELDARAYDDGGLLVFADRSDAGAVWIVTAVEVCLLGQLLREAGDRAVSEWRSAIEPMRVGVAEVASRSIEDGASTLEVYREAASRAGDVETMAVLDLRSETVSAAREHLLGRGDRSATSND